MSLRVSKEVVRWGQRYFLSAKAIKAPSFPSQRLAHIWGPGRSQTCLTDRSPGGSVRFHSQNGVYSQDVEGEKCFSSPVGDASLPAETQFAETQQTLSFIDDLKQCASPSDVLDLTSQHSLGGRRASNSLSHMWLITKKMSNEQKRSELQLMFEHPAFEKLLQKAMNTAGNMSNQNLVYSLLSIVKLGVPQKSRVVQTFLLSCQENLNDFDEKGLSMLAGCLENMEVTTNVRALKAAMSLVVVARLPEIKNVMALQSLMRLLGKDAPLALKQKLERKALSMTDQFSCPNAHYMLGTMATMNFYSKPLLDVCSKMIIENIHGFPFNRLYGVLKSCRELKHRDIDLLTAISEYVASMTEIWTQKQVILFLCKFEDLAFCPVALMEAFAKKVIANPDAVTRKDLFGVLRVYSSLNYDLQQQRQQFLEGLTQTLESYLPNLSGFELLRAVYYLCLLGHFPSAPLEHLLESRTLESFTTTTPSYLPNQERMFQTVNLCLSLERPVLPRPLAVPPSVLGNPFPSSPPVNPWLSQGLHSVLADQTDTTLQEMVVVENFYLIDAVITKPLPDQTSVNGASRRAGEEHPPAESSQRIAVICTPRSGFCINTLKPRGHLAVKIRHLKILGYDPVPVTEQKAASEEERTDYLRGRIFPEPEGGCQDPHLVQ